MVRGLFEAYPDRGILEYRARWPGARASLDQRSAGASRRTRTNKVIGRIFRTGGSGAARV